MMGKADNDAVARAAPLAAMLMGILFVLIAYQPVLAPLGDASLQFTYGDLNAPYGEDSASIGSNWTFYTFDQGSNRMETNRFYTLAGATFISNWLEFSESQFMSALIALCVILGSAGLFLLAGVFIRDWRYCSAASFAFTLFYFLNLWSVERLCHLWIWFTYAVFPLALALGFMFLKDGKRSRLIAYSIVMSFFGFIPHSLMYLLFFHAFIIAFAVLSGKKRGDLALFAIVPLIIYIFINLPPLTLGQGVSGEMVSGIGESSVNLLSKNGQLANLFAFSNNWWYQVGKAAIFSNPAFTYSSIGIFALVFLAFGLAHGRMGCDERTAALLALICMLAVMFIAQGAKNGILAPMLSEIAKSDFSMLLRPFREWARICVLIPPLVALVLASCLDDKALRLPIIACLFILLLANLSSSPSWLYLSDVHAATHGIKDFQYLKDHVGIDSKAIWPLIGDNRLPTTTASGKSTYTNTGIRRISGIGRLYYSGVVWGYEDGKLWKIMPRPLMDALNIRDVITIDAHYAFGGYGWMGCVDLTSFVLCHDAEASAPLRIYDGAIVANTSAMEPLFHFPIEDYAITSENASFGKYYAGWNGAEGANAGGGRIYLIEAESMLMGKKSRFFSPSASNRTAIYFPGNLTTAIKVMDAGHYGIALLGNGSFEMKIGNASIGMTTADGGRAFGGPVYLEKGDAAVSIKRMGYNESLDAILIYGAAGNDSALGPFEAGTAPPARITDYAKIDPTRWRMNISADRPFLLAFAETFDQRWVADVYKGGIRLDTIRPTSLYDTMNGYWINETGELEVALRYEPQDMYERTIGVSVAAMMVTAGLLALSVLKERESDAKS